MKHKIRNVKKESGFTLIEIMVTVAIFAILTAIAIPGIAVFLPNYKLKTAVQDLFSNMQSAKLEAIRTNSSYTISFNTANNSYNLNGARDVFLSEYGSGIEYGNPSGSAVVEYAGTPPSVTFNRRGIIDPPTDWKYVYIKNSKDRYYRVGTLSTGLIRLQRWNGSDFE